MFATGTRSIFKFQRKETGRKECYGAKKETAKELLLGLLAIPNGCPKLVSLNISSHTYTAAGLMALIFGLRNLRSVTVNNGMSGYIYGEMMRSIATFSPNLRIIVEAAEE